MNAASTRTRTARYRRAALYGLAGALLVFSGVLAVNAVTTTNLGTWAIKLSKALYPFDADVVVTGQAIGTVAASGAASGTAAPGLEATAALPKANNALTAGNNNYTFQLKESSLTSLQSGENFKIEVYKSGVLQTTLFMQQATVDDASVEGVSVEVDVGAAAVTLSQMEAVITRQSVPIAFDAASFTSANAASLTWAHTVGAAGTGRILVVGVSFDPRGQTITGVTYAGLALTFLGGVAGTSTRAELWYMVAPPTGTNNVVVSGTGVKEKIAGATSWTGVHQTTPLGTAVFAQATSITPTVNVTSAAGEVVVDAFTAVNTASATVDPLQTQRWNVAQGDYRGGGSSEPGAATVTMSWTLNGSFPWSIGAVPLKQANP